MSIADIWIMREPAISSAEWRTLVKARDDFVVVEAASGETRDGTLIALGDVFFWTGGSAGKVAFSFSEDGIQVSPIDPETFEFVRNLAGQLSATLHEI
jgi:hypothetical protein